MIRSYIDKAAVSRQIIHPVPVRAGIVGAREVVEEVSVQASQTDRVVALINDDSTEVGQVHLGIVHYWALDDANVTKREQMITPTTFMTPAELQEVRDSLETRSQLCLGNLDEIAKRAESGTPLRPVRDHSGD
ncbi:MAG: hypothetical protein IIB57_10775 [Planctomycetes bacterium]|nr:hypothetical protein [Planctomycetota bacterium]